MNKLRTLILLIIVLYSTISNAQLVHTKGSINAGIEGSYVLDGINTGLRINYLTGNTSMFSIYCQYEKNKFEVDDFDLIYYGIDYKYTYLNIGNWWYFDIGTGFFASNEFGNSPIFGEMNKFSIGEKVYLNVDYFINKNLYVCAFFGQRFHQLSNLGKLSWYTGVGVFYNVKKIKVTKRKIK